MITKAFGPPFLLGRGETTITALPPRQKAFEPYSKAVNVGKYQNGTSYTRVSARHNWDARAPLWVSFSKAWFWAKNVLSPSGSSALCGSWEQYFATFDGAYLYFTENPLPKPQPSSLIIYSTKSSIESCPPARVVSWNVMSKKRTLQTNIKKENEKKKKKKQHRKTSLTGFEPTSDQSEIVKLSTAPRGIRQLLTVEELIFFVTWFFFEFILALGVLAAHPAPGITVLFHRNM